MIGLIAFAILFAWIAVVIWIARSISRHLKTNPPLRPVVSIIAGVVIFWLPVADELAARPFFYALCRDGAVLTVNADKIKGKKVRVLVDPSNAPVDGSVIPTFRSHVEYRDATSGEVLAQYDIYRARGGALARAIPFPGSGGLTGDFFCAPKARETMQAQYGFVVLD